MIVWKNTYQILIHMPKLTKELAEKAVEHIEHVAGDDEQAHAEEDSLKDWFIRCVSENMYTKKEMVDIARVVNSTSDIEFTRCHV